MLDALLQLGLFFAKSIIIVLLIVTVLVVFFILLAKSKEKIKNRLVVKNLSEKYEENKETILAETLPKKELKKYFKDKKAAEKNSESTSIKNVYVLNFNGDMKASCAASLGEEITAVLNVATPNDEVVLRLESPGGTVHGYGLAAAQLMRIRDKKISLTICVDKVAASGGYMMACVANKILCAPFALIGSIGVVIQLPNFHRLLKDKHIDFELQTAGEFKRTITLFGENTEKGREKLQEEIEDIHSHFKNLISKYRTQIDIQKVATGEYWLGEHALGLNLVDAIQTSDDYLLESSKNAKLYEICLEIKKPLLARLTSSAALLRDKLFGVSNNLMM